MSNQQPASDFQLECFRAANSRLLFRVRRRENWLNIQIMIQLVFLVLNVALEDHRQNLLLHVSLPVAFIFCSLYASEDRLVGHIVSYLNKLGEKLSVAGDGAFLNLESSPEGKDYVKTALPVRLLAQVFGFLLLPVGITIFSFSSMTERQNGHTVELIIYSILSLVIAGMLYRSYQLRTSKS